MEFYTQATYLGAFLAGLLGGVHCLGMCGGIVAALSLNKHKRNFSVLFGYNLGRVMSYVLAGAIMGGIGQTLFSLTELNAIKSIVGVVAAVFMILLGVYLAGFWNGISALEKLGGGFWRRLEPFSRPYIPPRNFKHSIVVGAIWGWIPCGMVYTLLTWAILTGSWVQGGFLLLAFGIGTLPNLLAMGMLADKLAKARQYAAVKLMAGFIVACLGVVMLLQQI